MGGASIWKEPRVTQERVETGTHGTMSHTFLSHRSRAGQGGGESSQGCEGVGGGVQPQGSLLPVTPDDMWTCAPR